MKLTMIPRLMLALLLANSLFAAACGGGEKKDPEEGDPNTPAVGCLNATTMELAVPRGFSGSLEGTPGVIDEPGKVEFFQLTLGANAFVRIATESIPSPNEEGFILDPVISVYNTDGTELIATSNDVFLFGMLNFNAEVLYHAPAATTLCVAVEDSTSWVDHETLVSDPDFTFQVNAAELAELSTFAVDADNNNDIASAQPLDMVQDPNTGAYRGTACGTFDGSSDVDIYTFDSLLGGEIIINGVLSEPGPGASGEDFSVGNGSTLTDFRLSRVDATAAYYSSIFVGAGYSLESPTLDSSVYIKLEPAAGTAEGANDFYCVYFLIEPAGAIWDPIEGSAPNDDIATAVELELESVSGMNPFVLLKGEIDSPTDVDYYSFNVETPGAPYAMVCGAAYKGSGLVDATFTIQDSQETVIRSEVEAGAPVMWNESDDATAGLLYPENSGIHYLVISAEGQDPELLANNYTCRLQLY